MKSMQVSKDMSTNGLRNYGYMLISMFIKPSNILICTKGTYLANSDFLFLNNSFQCLKVYEELLVF